ncbi:Got1/Sft2-like family-domain-containing protein [Dioszegia hungarica]|uniref:Got1/Sft2-like family-domain-containing protein n=1 Tax=Dioszegia hungarica TaxID=4972 RepID=A0AA38H162_9TREE|nr:Got1/Sft2-like family-domain-containing protein [Dioszegia hungarica]KAI9631990.1 Got1/Sft2-like family-domain-containing protein [Dioszegia hungarica]
MWLSDTQKIGIALVAFGIFFQFLGIMLLFDGPLLALGNILFVSGLPLIIGPTKTFYFFSRREKWRGTLCFFGGILLVFCKWPITGIAIEFVGFVGLFGSFFPVILQALRQAPIIGTFLSLPYIRQGADRLAGVRQSAV